MRFRVFDPCPGSREASCGPRILATGEIEINSGSKLREFVRANQRAGNIQARTSVAFDSPGGNLLGGMQLGRVVRELGLDTELDRTYRQGLLPGETGRPAVLANNAVCASACTLAFLGGVERSVSPNGRYGVHQFYSSAGNIGDSATQLTVAAVSAYVAEMGVHRGLVEIASSIPPSALRYIDRPTLIRLNVDNTTPQKPVWSLESTPTGTVVASITETVPNSNRMINVRLYRAPDGVRVDIRFNPGGGKNMANDALQRLLGMTAVVYADDTDISEHKNPKWRLTERGVLETSLLLPPNGVNRLRSAKSLKLDFSESSMADVGYLPQADFAIGESQGAILAATR